MAPFPRNHIIFLLSFFSYHLLQGQAGILDPSFGNAGIVISDISSSHDQANSIVVLSDDKILLAGSAFSGYDLDFCIARYDADGIIDSSFGINGIVMTDFGEDDEIYNISVLADGSIIAAGIVMDDDYYANFGIAKYNSDGELDLSFGDEGKINDDLGSQEDYPTGLIIQTDQKIVVTGFLENDSNYDFVLVRYHPDGTRDSDYGIDGKVIKDFGSDQGSMSSALQTDGKIVLTGWDLNEAQDFAIARFNADGSIDSTFGVNGEVVESFNISGDAGIAIAVQDDGKIIVAGYTYKGSTTDFAIARLNPDGTFDETFSGDGKTTIDIDEHNDKASSVLLQHDGKILVGGTSTILNGQGYNFTIVRFKVNGALDESFGEEGVVRTNYNYFEDGNAIEMQTNGKILLAGDTYPEIGDSGYDFALLRYLNDDITSINAVPENDEEIIIYPNPFMDQFQINLADHFLSGTIKILNCLGEIIYQATEMENEFSINTLLWPAGIYVVQFHAGVNIVSFKIIKY